MTSSPSGSGSVPGSHSQSTTLCGAEVHHALAARRGDRHAGVDGTVQAQRVDPLELGLDLVRVR